MEYFSYPKNAAIQPVLELFGTVFDLIDELILNQIYTSDFVKNTHPRRYWGCVFLIRLLNELKDSSEQISVY